jgi:hypothetical protein
VKVKQDLHIVKQDLLSSLGTACTTESVRLTSIVTATCKGLGLIASDGDEDGGGGAWY